MVLKVHAWGAYVVNDTKKDNYLLAMTTSDSLFKPMVIIKCFISFDLNSLVAQI